MDVYTFTVLCFCFFLLAIVAIASVTWVYDLGRSTGESSALRAEERRKREEARRAEKLDEKSVELWRKILPQLQEIEKKERGDVAVSTFPLLDEGDGRFAYKALVVITDHLEYISERREND